jgi:type II secretory pathway pseudopilin PulG
MIERKNKFIRVRVIGGSGIFDSIVNILKKPAVSKMLTSAGKSMAAALGERLINSIMPVAALPAAPTTTPTAAQQQAVQQAAQQQVQQQQAVQQQQSRGRQLINAYGEKNVGAGIKTIKSASARGRTEGQALPKDSTSGDAPPAPPAVASVASAASGGKPRKGHNFTKLYQDT